MQDLKLVQNEDGIFDLEIQPDKKLFQTIDGLESALILQVFTDKRSTKDDVPNPLNRAGWIGDILTKNKGYEIGSFLYLKNQSRDTQIDRNEVKAFIEDCMKHFIEIGILKKIIIEIIGITFNAVLYKSENILEKFNKIWKDTKNV